jgi:hypothetical protein
MQNIDIGKKTHGRAKAIASYTMVMIEQLKKNI